MTEYVMIEQTTRIYDLGDGSLRTDIPKEDGTWSAEALLEDIEYLCDNYESITVSKVSQAFVDGCMKPKVYRDEFGDRKERE